LENLRAPLCQATYPQPFLSVFPGGFIDQVVGTALLVGVTFGFNSGYAINPARDFGPRMFTAVAGWGYEVFRAGNGWWWVPIVAPCVGGLLGGWVYDVCVGNRFADAGRFVPKGQR
jgi:glycerol uptake facilitator-like aquaporin